MSAAVRADVTVPVFRDKYAKGWPAKPNGERAVYTPIGVAMSKTYGTDAHFCAYSVPEVPRRLATSKVFAKLSDGLAMTLFVVDVDGPEHAAGDEWWAGERDKLSRLLSDHPNGFVFRTRGGYRIVYQLVEPVVLTTLRDAEQWKLRYGAWIEYLTQCYAIIGDKACKDWTRLYRLPRVLRDGEHQDLETIGDPHAIGIWDVTVELPTQTALTVRQPTTENVGTIGTLTHGERHPTMLSLAGAMRRQGADEATIVAALEKFNATRCSPPKPVAELYEIARFVGGKAPTRPASSRAYDGPPTASTSSATRRPAPPPRSATSTATAASWAPRPRARPPPPRPPGARRPAPAPPPPRPSVRSATTARTPATATTTAASWAPRPHHRGRASGRTADALVSSACRPGVVTRNAAAVGIALPSVYIHVE